MKHFLEKMGLYKLGGDKMFEFNTIEEATICRKKAQDKYFGEFSFKTNLNETNNPGTENEDNQRTYSGRSR